MAQEILTPVVIKGVVESTSGGFKFPDGSIQTTAVFVGTTAPSSPSVGWIWIDTN